jgi:hypothetical protein
VEAFKVGFGERFGEDVGGVVSRGDTTDGEEFLIDKVSCGVIFDVNVFDVGMVAVVAGEFSSRVIVAVEGSGTGRGKANTFEQFP